MPFGLRWRDQLPPVVVDEFENLINDILAHFSVTHDEDGNIDPAVIEEAVDEAIDELNIQDGKQGPPGRTGDQGDPGFPGPRGLTGLTGPMGPIGLPGDDGDDGAPFTVSNADIDHGVYTPTLTNVANLDASTAYQCQFMRVGNVVTVSGKVDIDPTAPAAAVQLGISLPIASNFGAGEDCGGTAAAPGIAGQSAAILADAGNDRAELQYVAGDVTNQAMYFSFTYRII